MRRATRTSRGPRGSWLVLALLLTAAPGVSRAELSVSIVPPVVEETARPGKGVKGLIAFTNRSEDPLAVEVSVADFDVGPENEVREMPPGTRPASLAPYLRVSPATLTVQPGQEVFFRYAVSAPEEFTHLRGMVFFMTRPELSEETSRQVIFAARLGIPVYVESPRADPARLTVRDIDWERLDDEQVSLRLEVENEGHRIYRPPGLVEVRSVDGRFRETFPFNEGHEPVLPGHTRRFRSSFGPLPEGEVEVRLHLNTSPVRRYRSPPVIVDGIAGVSP